MKPKTEAEYLKIIQNGPETVARLRARWEELKVTPCDCGGTSYTFKHSKADHAPIVNPR